MNSRFASPLARPLALLTLALAPTACVAQSFEVGEVGTGGAGGNGGQGGSANATSTTSTTGTSATVGTTTGAGGGCAGPMNCPMPVNACDRPTCEQGVCGEAPREPGAPCGQGQACDGSGTCVDKECMPGAARCSADLTRTEKCQGGVWVEDKNCVEETPFCLDLSTDTVTDVSCWDGKPYASVDTSGGAVELSNTASFSFGPDLTVASWIKSKSGFNSGMALLKNGVSGNSCGSVWVGFVPNAAGDGVVDFNLSAGGGPDKCGGLLFPVNQNPPQYPLAAYALTSTDWIHVAVTTSGGTTALYIDGATAPVASGTSTGSVASFASGNPLWIGREKGTNPQPFVGQIAHLQIWTRALEPSEIAAIGKRAGRMPVNTSGLYGHWPFDEGTGTTAHDASPNQRTGELLDGAVFVTN